MESSIPKQQLPSELVTQFIAIFLGEEAFELNKEIAQSLTLHFVSLGCDPYVMALSSGLCVLDYISKITPYVPRCDTIDQAAMIGNCDVLCHLITIKTRDIYDNHASFLRKLKRRLYILALHGHLETLKRCCKLIKISPNEKEICGKITCYAALGGHIEILDWLQKSKLLCDTEAACGAMGSENYDQVMDWVVKNRCCWDTPVIIKAATRYQNCKGLKFYIERFAKYKFSDTFLEQCILLHTNQECFEYLVTLMQDPSREDIIIAAMGNGYLGALNMIWNNEFELNNDGNSRIFNIFRTICKREIIYMSIDTLRWLKNHGYDFDLRSVKWAIKGWYPDIEVVKFLIEECGLEVDTGNTCRNAVKIANFQILAYLLEKGYPMNYNECLQVAEENVTLLSDDEDAKEMFRWLRVNQ
jgi:hypothetical protein